MISPSFLVLTKRKLNLAIQFCGKEPGHGVEDKLKGKGQLQKAVLPDLSQKTIQVSKDGE